MAKVPKSLLNTLRDRIAQINARIPVYAVSGGMDSAVLAQLAVNDIRGRGEAVAQYLCDTLGFMHYHHCQGAHDHVCHEAYTRMERSELCIVKNVGTVIADGVALRKGSNFEANARKARYTALAKFARAFTAARKDLHIVTAHHLNDQVEGILMGLCRGVSVSCLAMAFETVFHLSEGRTITIHRPFLDVSKDTLHALAKQSVNPAHYAEDTSNANVAFERNFFRHAVMPILAAKRNILKSIPKSVPTPAVLHIRHEGHLFDGIE